MPKLKSLNIFYARIEAAEVEIMLKDHRGIESFAIRRVDFNFDCKLLELIPNVEILVLDTFDWYVRNINSLQTLHHIKSLQLNCEKENLNDLIGAMAQTGIMEEMELHHLKVDDKFFEILKSFDKLRLLSISYANDEDDVYEPADWKLTTFACLPQLKCLLLDSFEFTVKTFISTIRQLKDLEKFDLSSCSITRRDKSKFKDFAKLSQQILEIIDDTGRQQRLDVVMPICLTWGKNSSKVNLLCFTKIFVKLFYFIFVSETFYRIKQVTDVFWRIWT